ncbi:hypothetical protein GUJ93_ZPchr0014g47334 [Zizania palustris]|uniref:Uncharacterized protein n=1 Tax=Zizania palustris TaxID=103762 RepID=A0A8J5TFP2_ZIZPA|nr:hypothetical protein GUJ93_ZPchr0014g47334 [Zizania palustris]
MGSQPSNWEFSRGSQELQDTLQHGKPTFELGIPRGFPRVVGLPLSWEANLRTGSSQELSRGFPRVVGVPSAWEAPFELGVPMGFLKASQASLQHGKPPQTGTLLGASQRLHKSYRPPFRMGSLPLN